MTVFLYEDHNLRHTLYNGQGNTEAWNHDGTWMSVSVHVVHTRNMIHISLFIYLVCVTAFENYHT
jgi:hypothetical protein